MSDPHKEAKDELRRLLQVGREALVATVEGIADGQAGRVVAGSGTSLLGLARHMATMEAGYLGQVFDNPCPEEMPWWDGESQSPTAGQQLATTTGNRSWPSTGGYGPTATRPPRCWVSARRAG